MLIYAYRLWPVIDRTLVDEKAKVNIDKIPAESSPDDWTDYMLKTHGSGKYQLRLHDRNAGKSGAEILRAEINLNNHDYPPLIADVREVVLGAPENKSYIDRLKREGKLGGQMQQNDPVAILTENLVTLAGQVAAKPQAQQSDLDQLSKLANVLKTMQSGNTQLDIVQLLTLLKTLLPAPAPAREDGSLVAKLMEQNTALLTRLIDAGQARDPMDEIERVMSLAKALGLSPGGKSTSMVSEFVQALPTIASAGAAMIAQSRMQPSSAGPGTVVPFPGVINASPADAPPLVNSAEAPMPTGDPAMMNPVQGLAIAKKALAAFERGTSGDSFAEGLCEYEEGGDAIYAQLAALGVEGLMAALQSSPAWPQLTGREVEVRVWLADFIQYGTASDAGQQEKAA